MISGRNASTGTRVARVEKLDGFARLIYESGLDGTCVCMCVGMLVWLGVFCRKWALGMACFRPFGNVNCDPRTFGLRVSVYYLIIGIFVHVY